MKLLENFKSLFLSVWDRGILGVDILMYQEIEDLVEAVTRRGDHHIENPCMACLDGHYVVNGSQVHELVKDLKVHIKYLMNQHHCYSALENLKEFKLPDKRLKRSKKIQKDIDELLDMLQGKFKDYQLTEILTDSTLDYGKYVKESINTYEDLWLMSMLDTWVIYEVVR